METNNPNTNSASEPLLQWQGRLHIHPKRTRAWYITATLLLLALLFFSITTHAWSFFILIIIASGIYFAVHHKDLPATSACITKEGLQIHTQFTYWQDCSFFWILAHKNYSELHIRRTRAWQPDLYITIDSLPREQIQEALLQFIPEHSQKNERFIDTITRLLKI